MDDRALEVAQDRFDPGSIRAFLGSNGELDFACCGGLPLGAFGVQIVAAYDRNRPQSQFGSRIDSLDVRGQQVSFLECHERGQDDDETRGVVLDRRMDPFACFGQDRRPWIGERKIRGSCRADRRIGVRRWVFESRVLDASLVVDVFESKATFVAHEVPLGLWVFPGAQPVDFVVVLIDLNAAARRATGTYAIGVLEPPDPFLVEEVLAAKGTDGAQVDDVAGEFVVAGGLWKDIDFFVRSPSDDLEFGRSADFSCEANAAGAHDTAVGKQSDLFSDVVLVLTLDFRLIESAVGLAILVGVILQVALAGLIADRAIEWMI